MKLMQWFNRSNKTDLFDLGEKRLIQLKAEGRYSSYRNTRATLRKLSRFRGGKPLPLGAVTPELVAGFREYLIKEEGNCNSTVTENIKILSLLLNQAGVSHDPCSGMMLKREEHRRNYLLEEELDRMMALRLEEGSELDRARDIFYLECRTGLRISDLLQLCWGSFNGETLQVKMQKTQREVTVPVTKSVRRILEKYRHLFSSAEERIFPFLGMEEWRTDEFSLSRALVAATCRVNQLVKQIADRAGIKKNISTHVGRHTFATMLISKGASIYEVKELLGHRDVKVTQVYAHLLDERKRELMEMLE
ncbi:MAG: site-specific integrase [Bacteroidales bacterium]|nr:site-specific integrase [Bacteroidales bacterium]